MRHFFILGCPRSGTTMLQQALNRHTQIVLSPETKFFFGVYGQRPKVRAAYFARISHDLGIDTSVFDCHAIADEDYRQQFEEIAQRYAASRSKHACKWFGEKTPEHSLHCVQVARVMPEALFIILTRDGRNVAESLSRVPWLTCGVYGGFAIWLRCASVLLRFATIEARRCLLIRYEDILEAPAQELGRICQFLDIPYESAMTDGYGDCSCIPARELAWKARSLLPLGGGTGALRSQQYPITRHVMGNIGFGTLREYGYDVPDRRRILVAMAGVVVMLVCLIRAVLHLPLWMIASQVRAALSFTIWSWRWRGMKHHKPATMPSKAL